MDYDPLPIDSEPRGFVGEKVLKSYDPLPLAESELQKFAHVFDEKQRVRVKETGQKGVLEGINAHKGHMVRLDSGHLIECRNEELEPADWRAGAPSGAQDYAREGKVLKSYDPLPVGDALEKAAGSHRLRLGGRIKMKDGRTGRLTRFTNGPDGKPLGVRVMLDDQPDTSPGIDVSLEDIEPDDDDTLSLDGSIYPVNNEPGFTGHRGKDTGEARTKAFRVGDRVRERVASSPPWVCREGTVTKADGGPIHVKLDDGNESIMVASLAEPADTCLKFEKRAHTGPGVEPYDPIPV